MGDSIKFSATAFHNVDIPAKGKKPVTLLVPTGTTIAGSVDAAGAPYWFNGFRTSASTRTSSTAPRRSTTTRSRRRRVRAGPSPTRQEGRRDTDPVRRQPQAADRQVLEGGDRQVLLRPAPRDGGRRPRPAKVEEDPERQGGQQGPEGADRPRLRHRQDAQGPEAAGQHDLRRQRGQVRRRVLQLPARDDDGARRHDREVPDHPAVLESHTATTGPGNPINDPNSYLGIIAASFFSSQFVPQGIYPSQPFGQVAALTPTSHGNGFWNSGGVDNVNPHRSRTRTR